jgi:2-C-methyl-D-erythritol 4-phosphate cytidylyltransferase
MVACSRENIKITEPADIAFACAILDMRRKAEAPKSEDEA